MLDPKLDGFDDADVVVEPNIDLGASAVGVALLVDIPAPPNENSFDGSAGLSLAVEAGVVPNVLLAPFPNTFGVVVGVEPNAGAVVVEPNAGVAVEPNAGVVPNPDEVLLPNAAKGDFADSLFSVDVEADDVPPNAGAAVVLPNIPNADFGASFVSVTPWEAEGAPNAGAAVVLPNAPNTDLGASFVSVAFDPNTPNGVGADVEAALFAKRFPPVNPAFPNADFGASVIVC